jgi:DNA-binding GntR family transcriptional regulator
VAALIYLTAMAATPTSPPAGEAPAEDAPAEEAPSVKLEADRAYVDLRDRIVTLKLQPGTVLREDELMRDLDVGRTPLREAVKRLALENLVAVQPRRGTFVTPVEAADIVNISEVRAELEGYAAALAAERLDDGHRAAAEALMREVEDLAESGDQDWLMRFDERIHRFTWEAAGNPYLVQTLERYFTHSLRIWYLVLDRLPGLGHAVHDQTHLVEALLAGDSDKARAIMQEHVLDFQRELLAAFSRT